jgi:DtxR family transcriptional regulator, Mn-dependent transcriptional regulator
MRTVSEENYLKAVWFLSGETGFVNTNALAEHLNMRPSSITDMVRKLSQKGYLHHAPYKGVALSNEGEQIALGILRKHRLWEVFLVEHLGFGWEDVHEIAEQLEHIASDELVDKLDAYLGHPKFDPHGDPIPDGQGKFQQRQSVLLCEMTPGESGVIVGVSDASPALLKYLREKDIGLGTELEVSYIHEFDNSMEIILHDRPVWTVSEAVSKSIQVSKS